MFGLLVQDFLPSLIYHLQFKIFQARLIDTGGVGLKGMKVSVAVLPHIITTVTTKTIVRAVCQVPMLGMKMLMVKSIITSILIALRNQDEYYTRKSTSQYVPFDIII